jgi:hypothetical protein
MVKEPVAATFITPVPFKIKEFTVRVSVRLTLKVAKVPMVTASVEPGTPLGDQLAASPQLVVFAPPVQV